MSERIQDDVVADNIVTKAVLAGSDSILTFAYPDVLELLDMILTASVVRVILQDGFQLKNGLDEFRIAAKEIAYLAIKT